MTIFSRVVFERSTALLAETAAALVKFCDGVEAIERDSYRCVACFSGTGITWQIGGVPFCRECLEWARMENLSELDDLGVID
jgi:hypothetical protein